MRADEAPRWSMASALGALVLGLTGLAAATQDGSQQEEPPASGAAGVQAGAESRWRERETRLLERILELEAQLEQEREQRHRRELEWLEFTRVLGSFELPGAPQAPEYLRAAAQALDDEAATDTDAEGEGEGEEGAREQGEPADAAALDLERERSRALRLRHRLNGLLAAEYVLQVEFLELGRVQGGYAGPIVARTLDERGRPTGSLSSDRLRLVGSRSGRSVTMVFERTVLDAAATPETTPGAEGETPGNDAAPQADAGEPDTAVAASDTAAADSDTAAAESGTAAAESGTAAAKLGTAAEEGVGVADGPVAPVPDPPPGEAATVRFEVVHRIVLEDVNVDRWLRAVGELFDVESLTSGYADVRYPVVTVHATLNELLARAPGRYVWVLRSLSSVRGGALREVFLEQRLRGAGERTIERRLFADELSLRLESGLVELELRDGVQERGPTTVPFLDGHFRVVLPGLAPTELELERLPWSGLAVDPAQGPER